MSLLPHSLYRSYFYNVWLLRYTLINSNNFWRLNNLGNMSGWTGRRRHFGFFLLFNNPCRGSPFYFRHFFLRRCLCRWLEQFSYHFCLLGRQGICMVVNMSQPLFVTLLN